MKRFGWLLVSVLAVGAAHGGEPTRKRGERVERPGARRAPGGFKGTKAAAGDPLVGMKLMSLRSIRSGTPQMVMAKLREAIEEHPDDPDLHALLGIALAQIGQYPEAGFELSQGEGSSFYEDDGLAAHADVLRAFGDGEGAATLRLQGYLSSDPAIAARTSLASVVHDLRYAGDLDGAWDVATMAIAQAPRSAGAHAAMAHVLMDLGDLDGAGFHVWLATELGSTSTALLVASSRLALLGGDFESAEADASAALSRRMRSKDLLVTEVEVLWASGQSERALALLEKPRWGSHQIPALMAIEAMVRWDLGQTVEARELLARAVDLYPLDPDVQVAVHHLEGG